MINKIALRMQGISPFYVMELLQRAKQLEHQGRDIIHMEVGEPDFPTPPEVVQAGIDNIQTGQVKYTPAAGLLELREKIAQYYQDHYHVDVAPHRIFITPGASGAFLLALGVCVNPGEEILLSDPCYPCNSNFIKLFGGIPSFVPVSAETDYQLTAELIEHHWSESCKGAIVASPSNPTGTLISETLLNAVIDIINDKGACFFSDEIYHGLVYGKQAATALKFSEEVFVINSFSKYFGMTGWRVGWLIVPEVFTRSVEKLAQNIFISTPTHSQFAALAAFSKTNLAELTRRNKEFSSRRDYLYTRLQQIGFKIKAKPEGAFYIYADCSDFTQDSFQFAKDLLEETGVAITPGKDFGHNHANTHVRFAYTTSLDRLEEGVARLERFIKEKK
jgi:aspartate/methionine/tyrosine aminotransferase